MSVARSAPDLDLTCPLCGSGVPATAAACRGCHLPIADVRRHAVVRRSGRARSLARAIGIRLLGLVVYAALVAWSAWQLPASLPFVVLAAAAGGFLHGVKGRPWLGLLAFAVLVVALPLLMAPALGAGAFSDLSRWIDDPQWW